MKFDWNRIKNYINNCSDSSKVYVGCDSEKYIKNGTQHARYTAVVVIHIDGCRGCKVFGEVTYEEDYDTNPKKPSLRLMNEVYKGVETYKNLIEIINERDLEIHLDISTKETAGSNCVLSQAIGYVRGTCNIVPKVKPNAFAASYAADHFFNKIG